MSKTRSLGPNRVGNIAFGAMSIPLAVETEAMATLDTAWESGITHFDTANIYGRGVSESLIGKWLKSRGHNPMLATKASILFGPPRSASNDPAYLRAELEGSLQRLGRDHVDLFYMHRRNEETPLEDLIGLMQDLINEGKISGYGLSEVSPATLRRAHAIHPCTAVQNEYSLWTRLPELGLLDACAELGVAFLAFSPLGRGIFGDQPMQPPTDFFRAVNPRFTGDNFTRNLEHAARFRAFCQSRGWGTAATALAWVLSRGEHIIALPGTSKASNLKSWLQADEISLSAEDRAEINRILPAGFAHGVRYTIEQLNGVENYC